MADFDVIDFLHAWPPAASSCSTPTPPGSCSPTRAAACTVMASSAEEARLLELYEIQNNEGPCLDCFRSGRPVARDDLPAMRTSWPAFTEQLQGLGFRSRRLTDADLSIGQAMAGVATVGLIQERAIADTDIRWAVVPGY